ncbi:hypothetical protein AVENLUH7437_01542 [Acinetobacter venetianus]|nr:hypothetical protein AVENLUH7437_01542 [Acinetobacter venetianus]
MIKSIFRISLYMVTVFVRSIIQFSGLNWTAPDYSTLCRRQKHINIAISYQKSHEGLHLLVDLTGLKFLGEWKRKKHQPECRRQWRKLHRLRICTKLCRKVISDRHAHAAIPQRKNSKPLKDEKLRSLERNELLKTVKRLGRTLWKKWSGYHQHSLVETKMQFIKLMGDKLSARSYDSQVNEIHARVAVLNKFTELGRPHTQVVT